MLREKYDPHPESDNSKAGKFNEISETQKAYGSLAPDGNVMFYSTTTIREKCSLCDINLPCCQADCSIYEDKTNMIEVDDPCQSCEYGGQYCYTSKELDSHSDTRTNIRDFSIKDHQGKSWRYDDIDNLEDDELKLVLGFRFLNKFYRHIGKEAMLFKFKKDEGKYIVLFSNNKFEFRSNTDSRKIFETIWSYSA